MKTNLKQDILSFKLVLTPDIGRGAKSKHTLWVENCRQAKQSYSDLINIYIPTFHEILSLETADSSP